MECELRVLGHNWYRMKQILLKIHQDGNLEQNEIELVGDSQQQVKPEDWGE